MFSIFPFIFLLREHMVEGNTFQMVWLVPGKDHSASRRTSLELFGIISLELLVSREKLPLKAGNAYSTAKTAFPWAMGLMLALGGMKLYFLTLRLGFQLPGAKLHPHSSRAEGSSGKEGIR